MARPLRTAPEERPIPPPDLVTFDPAAWPVDLTTPVHADLIGAYGRAFTDRLARHSAWSRARHSWARAHGMDRFPGH